jgi:hypothetical protein
MLDAVFAACTSLYMADGIWLQDKGEVAIMCASTNATEEWL